MPALKIHPLHLGTLIRPRIIFFYDMANMAKPTEAPVLAWYIEGSDKKILIDTGGEDPASAPHRAPYTRERDQTIDQALGKIGVQCQEIDIVINTHLHWDHCCGNELFPKAQIIVQDEELRYARSPLPIHAGAYIKSVVEKIDYTVIAGDREIAEGVSVILTPGHSYGMQGVLVQAEACKYFLASDTVGLFECLEREPPAISGVYVDVRKYYESLEKIAALSAVVLPGHDMKVLERKVYS
ncbi:MAG: N-acyl homoserine lactonase family protein [Candidatus Tectomicrobia bacterium]|uniref:N-acyl homoserine lactonase family protein n=1 Tax=Tectimicrobiota bacterium TaxID=2528274 RepID=A0A933LRN9_UNCTE|nr:N-acyl homoserine lactonase family protein [Candidatus Tectomicrobia bacterium]